MSSVAIAIYAFLLFTFIYTVFLHRKQRKVGHKKPPGPPALPMVGNLHMLGTLPHRTLQSLSKKYGPIMSLQLGNVPAIVVSSSEAAELFLKTHDTVFASRPKIQASEVLSYGSKGLAFSEYGPYWRSVRKLCTLQLLTASKVELCAPIRREELCLVVKSLEKDAAAGRVVNLSEVVENLVEDMVYKMMLGRTKYDQFDLKRLVQKATKLVGSFNIADYVPWLGVFDLQGITRNLKETSKAIDEVLEKVIKEHELDANVDKRHRRDFVDILLSKMHQPMDPQSEQSHVIINRTNVKAILLDMIVGAIETSATVVEWALSELLRHPRVMKVLQDEIEHQVGIGRMVEETDLMTLSYLDMVVNETLRLYPVGPLLIPRESRESITIGDYYIKKKSRVIINAWTIGRDPKVWSDNAETFYPERFMKKKVEHQGQNCHFVPFGSGRRGCPGMQLGLITVKLVMAQLVHCFNWELPCNVTPDNLNMQEKFGLSIPRAQQLQAIPSYRLANDRRHPPGPPGLPVIGNLHMLLGKLPHRTLEAMAKTYGPIMSLRLGQVPTIIVSSSEAVEQFIKTHDAVFASRPRLEVCKYFGYGSKGLVFSEYGAYWRNMRKVCTSQLLSASKVQSFAPLRKREIELAVNSLEKAAMVGEVVDLSEVILNLLQDIVYKMVLGSSKHDEFDLKGLIQQGMSLTGAFNLADYVPWLGALDLQGLTRGFKKTSKALDQLLEKIIKEHEQGSDVHKDFIDVLLSLMHRPIDPSDEQNHVIDRTNIKAIVLDMIAAAFETSATVVEWAFSELLKHPRVMKNLQEELDNVVGMKKLVEENDLAKLSYLDIVIKETLRLYPPGPLVPRESTEDAMINGYFLEKNSRIIINLWAIGRDTKIWSNNAEVFCPERFIDKNLDFRGLDFQFIPFGSGRRGCPGIHLGLITVKLGVAQLAHCFSWELPPTITPDDLDMSEKFGLTIPRAEHLLAVPKYRL
ncbi:uncharacterized protein LOC133290862 [Gastrolobium bilobum]|uniref:uncharacterized protein LOC133290862 n=1 Tax=Gastrolobium bilobum TaxID=150636 RepID=UPI002AB2F771|nr:uncharacterized protein LOC133290862 [Gastrolobium bilobum]